MSAPLALGVLGDPIAHSLSPALHATMIRHWGLDAIYLPFRVAPEGLAGALGGVRALGIRGVNLTLPHKVAAAALVDRLEGDARILEAVNTVRLEADSTLGGHNTDARGLELALRHAPGGPCANQPKRGPGAALILGAGGAARAAVLALARLRFDPIALAARRTEQAEELCRALRAALPPGTSLLPALLQSEPLRSSLQNLGEPALIVQATPCGVGRQAEEDPWPAGLPLPADAACLDLVYRSEPSPFLRRAAGRWCADGLAMLVWQGALALRIFCGAPLPPAQQARAWEQALRAQRSTEDA